VNSLLLSYHWYVVIILPEKRKRTGLDWKLVGTDALQLLSEIKVTDDDIALGWVKR
jgi:hypothetical protein